MLRGNTRQRKANMARGQEREGQHKRKTLLEEDFIAQNRDICGEQHNSPNNATWDGERGYQVHGGVASDTAAGAGTILLAYKQ